MLAWNRSSGWVSVLSGQRSLTPIFWLPEELRGEEFTARGATVVLGGRPESVTIVDVSVLVRDLL
jgi:hypothetical protein